MTRHVNRWREVLRARASRGVRLNADDRTARHRLTSAHPDSAETLALLETLQANAPVGLGFVDRNFRRVRVNETLAGFNGSTVAEQIGQQTAALVPQFWSQLEPLYRLVLDSERPVLDMEISGPSWDDPTLTRYWRNSYYPVSVRDHVIGIGIVAVEVTERRRSAQTHRQLAAIVEASADAIIGCTVDGTITSWNAAAERVFGFTAQEIIGQPAIVLAPPDLIHEQEQVRTRIAAHGGSERYETWRRRKDGSLVEVLVTSSPVTGPAGGVASLSVFIQDITARKAVEVATRSARAEQTHRQLSAIVEASADAIFGCTLDGEITSWNAAAERLFGFTAQEMIGRPTAILAPPELEQEQEQVRARIATEGTSERYETWRRRKDGGLVEVHITCAPVTNEANGIMSLSVFIQDITARKQIESAMTSARLEAEQANAAKNEFLSRVSHELRTPMNAVLGFGQLLKLEEATLSDPQREAVGHILTGGRHLLAMIDDVLDISRIETDQFDIALEPVHVAELLQEAMDLSSLSASAAGIELLYNHALSPTEDPHVRADRRRLLQVVLNLVSNAIKYNSPRGNVTASIEPQGDTVVLKIADTGLGIHARDLPRLFTPFDRLGQQATSIPGTGIGLALTQRLVAIMGGELLVHSTFGVGSTFSVVLPVAGSPVSLEPVGATQREKQKSVPRPELLCSVLYIEDNRPNVALMERLVQHRSNWVLTHAENGRRGIDIASTRPPTLVMLDLHLPDMKGIDVLLALRAEPATAAIPIVVLSADASPQEIARLHAAGADAYRTKPLNISEILRDLDTYSAIAADS